MTAREAHLVELVDTDGSATGSMTVNEAHQDPGHLHRAFSVFLRDADGRVLLQQRAAVKTRFPLRWANTCCGHPTPDEPLTVAAAKRLDEELGIRDVELTEVGVFTYRAEDPATGRVEHEYDHVLVGEVPADVRPAPDPDEVVALRWTGVPSVLQDMEEEPGAYAPWLRGALLAYSRDASAVPPSEETAERSGDR